MINLIYPFDAVITLSGQATNGGGVGILSTCPLNPVTPHEQTTSLT